VGLFQNLQESVLGLLVHPVHVGDHHNLLGSHHGVRPDEAYGLSNLVDFDQIAGWVEDQHVRRRQGPPLFVSAEETAEGADTAGLFGPLTAEKRPGQLLGDLLLESESLPLEQ